MVEPEAARGKNPGSIQRPIRNTGAGSRTHVAWTPEFFCYGEKESGYDSLPYSDGRSGHLEPRSEMQGCDCMIRGPYMANDRYIDG